MPARIYTDEERAHAVQRALVLGSRAAAIRELRATPTYASLDREALRNWCNATADALAVLPVSPASVESTAGDIADRVMAWLEEIAASSITDVASWDAEGVLTFKASADIPESVARTIQIIKSTRRVTRDRDGNTTTTTEIELRREPKAPVLALMAKIAKLVDAEGGPGGDGAIDMRRFNVLVVNAERALIGLTPEQAAEAERRLFGERGGGA